MNNNSESANPPTHFEILKGYASFRPAGEVSLDEGVRLVSQAIAYAFENDLGRLLVDVSQLTGFPPPNIIERYYIVHEWAPKARGRVKVSILAREEMVDPQKFGVMAASNIGFLTDVFTSDSEAVAWLLDESRE